MTSNHNSWPLTLNFILFYVTLTTYSQSKKPWNGFWCVHFYVSRKWFCFTYTPNEIWKILKSPEMDFDVYIFTFRVKFYVSRIRQTQIWKLPKFPEMGSDVYIFMFCVNFFVLRIRQTQIWKIPNSLEWVLMCTFLCFA